MVLLMFVLLQVSKAQTITTLAPQSNCPNSVYVDYIAKAKIQQQQLIIFGELVAAGDSVLQIIFSVEKAVNAINKSSKENIDCLIEKVKWQQEKWEQFFYCDKIKNSVELQPNNKIVGKNEITVYVNLLEKSTGSAIKKEVELVLVCTAIYKNGCKYIKKQKISFGY